MAQTCERHSFELSVGMCRRCGLWYCPTCLVFPFGAKKPPFCVSCAINAGGVRSTAGLPPARPAREIKRELRAQRRMARKGRHEEHAHDAASAELPPPDAEAVPAQVGHDDAPARTPATVKDQRFADEVSAWKSGDQIWTDTIQR